MKSLVGLFLALALIFPSMTFAKAAKKSNDTKAHASKSHKAAKKNARKPASVDKKKTKKDKRKPASAGKKKKAQKKAQKDKRKPASAGKKR
ncbi:MAG: hypothetical protein AAB250_18730 [Bdellovibrionota bacterium]